MHHGSWERMGGMKDERVVIEMLRYKSVNNSIARKSFHSPE